MAVMFRYGPGKVVARPGKAAGARRSRSRRARASRNPRPRPGDYGAAAAPVLRRAAIGGNGWRPRYGRPAAIVTRLLVAVFT
jgi:hypothetical protein